jgi:anthranilate synthase component 1
MNLEEIRKKIDQKDSEIFAKISERLKLVEQVVRWKDKNGKKIYDPNREQIIIQAKRELAEELGISADTGEEILRSIIAESHLQEKKFLQHDETSPRKVRKKRFPIHPELLEIFAGITAQEKNFCFLESLGDDEWNQQSMIAFRPEKIFAAKQNEVFIDGVSQGTVENPLEWLENQFKPYQNLVENSREEGFVGGLIGHMGFEAVNYTENSLQLPSHPDFYDFEFGLYLDALVYNRKTEILDYIFIGEDRSKYILEIFEKSKNKISSEKTCTGDLLGKSFSDEELDVVITQCKTEIENGNVFQIVPSQKFYYQLSGSSLEFYTRLRKSNPSPHMFFLQFEDRKIIGSSPEMIAKVIGKRIETYPIAGTRSRGTTPQEDAKLSADMLSDEKEVAEHLMLVDMARNDLGRVCEFGSVKVEETMALKKYSHVQHLVSRVSGKIIPDKNSLEAMLANFPMGTVSGSPRIETIKLIQKLEKEPRGPYSGGVGYWSATGDMIFALAIRSFFSKGDKGFAQAGAGIVYDSVPKHERAEIEKKSMNIRSLLE